MLVIGASGLEREMRDVGLDVVTSAHAATRMSQEGIDGWDAAGRPDAVVAGLDPQLTYARLAVASDAIRAGARFFATNRDPTYPTERGFQPGAGTVVAALEVASGVTPLAIGKPGPLLLEEAAKAVGGVAREAVMIGDALSDIAAAHAVGCRSVLMLTGVTTRERLGAVLAAERPTAVAEDAAELGRILEEFATRRRVRPPVLRCRRRRRDVRHAGGPRVELGTSGVRPWRCRRTRAPAPRG